MGCCLQICFPKHSQYDPIPENTVHNIATNPTSLELVNAVPVQGHAHTSDEPSPFHNVGDASFEQSVAREFDPNSLVFKGTVVDQKFTNKSSFEPKFAWINLTTRSINLSEHISRDRRHKEASIADIVTVVAGPPEKYRPPTELSATLDFRLCLTVNFQRGGGIDLKFKSEEERDQWCSVLTKLVKTQQSSSS